MDNKEILEFIGLNRQTLWNWQNNKSGKDKKLLYEILKFMPIEFVKKVKKHIENEEKLKENLNNGK